ncbi:MAG: hypothetical protein AAF368_15900, partial [Planctomycetota bacterium]
EGAYPGQRLDRLDPEGTSQAEPHWVVGLAGNSAGVFLDGWYFLLNVRVKGGGRGFYHPGELFELAPDPMCETDVAEVHPERAARMRHLLVNYLADLPEGGVLRVKQSTATNADRADMVALGYGGSTEEPDDDLIVDPECACMFCARDRKILDR